MSRTSGDTLDRADFDHMSDDDFNSYGWLHEWEQQIDAMLSMVRNDTDGRYPADPLIKKLARMQTEIQTRKKLLANPELSALISNAAMLDELFGAI